MVILLVFALFGFSLLTVSTETTVAPTGMTGLLSLGFAWIVGRRKTGLNLLNADHPVYLSS